MNNDQLSTKYRNLLIAIAKTQKSAQEKSVLLRNEAQQEPTPGRRSGLFCLARAYSKHGHAMRTLLLRNSATLKQFFKTTDIATVSKKEILLTSKRAASTVAPALNKTSSKPSGKS